MAKRPYAVGFTGTARIDLAALKPFEGRRVGDAIVADLRHEPFVASRNRKPLDEVEASFPFEPPLWELRVGDIRVFFDGSDAAGTVTVRAIRRKGQTQTTQEVLS